MNASELLRFLNKVEVISAGCWMWKASKDKRGYGNFTVGSRSDGTRKVEKPYRLAYEHWVGKIPDNLELDHLCRNPQCVNPYHLDAVTHKENVLRGNSPTALNARKTKCKFGHPLDGRQKSGRFCKQCHKQQKRNHMRRKRGIHE